MANKIVVDPAKLKAAATQIDGQVGEYIKQYGQLFSEVEKMGAAWQGIDNEAFVRQILGFKDDFEHMKDVLTNYSTFLKDSSTEYTNTQNDRINEAKKLRN
ncbi:WXG100 family type VII secretion target [Paenibacillus sp. V4I9]|uniref:WXG100 family type VII secretion target n=1 Tax=Paenibacillus sp. V4I9 TaxID=3042308 RepID=UPI00278734F0|nr:WXG100 family type VII secretion target [Paenibacillus sp. V4I9]MDQ0885066.1 WXG100 family type VII secretion target [Paenibacillus sp. V4I9]